MAEAVKLPIPKDTSLKAPADFKIIGQRTARIDGRDIVTGRAHYGIDTKVPGMLYASVERPPFRGATPKKMNESAARAVRGVRSIVQTQRGVAVVAENTWAAMKGRVALAIEWSEPSADAFDSDVHAKKLEEAARAPANITRKEEAPADTPPVARTIDAIYSYPFYAHAPVETMNCVADVRDDRCTIWAPTQAPNRLQKQVATLLGTTPEKVEVNVTLIGGGFGRRLAVDYALEAAEISRAAQAPVQVLWSRPDDTKHGHFQAASAHFLLVGLDSHNKPVSWKHTKAGSFHNLSTIEPEKLRDAAWYRGWSWGVYDFPYVMPGIETGYVPVDLPVLHGPWRSVFAPSSIFARECFIDEVAHECGADPLAFRLQLLQGADTFTIGNDTYDRRPLRRVLEIVRDKSEWTKKAGKRH
ncbi:MAG TPA: molybdopterin cofactor-binding domain-containing protein, partial [Chthoniobacterales bacterium]|nr:molybdopterin cofactor-binding domain-containing protein [Chthoniobacterales bacterium]